MPALLFFDINGDLYFHLRGLYPLIRFRPHNISPQVLIDVKGCPLPTGDSFNNVGWSVDNVTASKDTLTRREWDLMVNGNGPPLARHYPLIPTHSRKIGLLADGKDDRICRQNMLRTLNNIHLRLAIIIEFHPFQVKELDTGNLRLAQNPGRGNRGMNNHTFLLSTFFGGWGLIIYLALWLIMPKESEVTATIYKGKAPPPPQTSS